MSFTIYLARHGQTILNKYRRLQGWCDSPLTDQGVKDAQIAGEHLQNVSFNAAYASDTLRAIRTGEEILKQNQNDTPNLKTIPYFREQGFGYFEGSDSGHTWVMAGAPHGANTYYQILDQHGASATRDFLHEADPFGNAEDEKTFQTRISEGFEYLKQHHHNGENILLVSHSLTIRTIVDRFAPEYDAPNNGPKNGSVTKLTVIDDGQILVDYYNHFMDGEKY